MSLVNFKKGLLANLPESKSAGTVYIATDERAIYFDVDSVDRIRLGDFVEVPDAASLPESGANATAMYYAQDENALFKWNGVEWVEIGPDLNAYRTATEQDVIDRQKYTKPSTGIPKSDLSSAVQTSLNLADSALQSYTETDPTVPAWAKEDSKPDYSAGEIAFGGTNVYDELTTINGLISDQATTTNKLVSASEMGDAIMAVEAKQLYATAAQGSFANKAALTGASVFYNADGTVATPTKNDVAYVLADESHSGKSAKYVVASTNPIVWGFVITFSDATFTQTQMDAVNSGITSAKRTGYDNHVADSTIHVTSADKTAWNGKENASNKVNTISGTSTAVQYPSAKAVYDYIQSLDASEVSY